MTGHQSAIRLRISRAVVTGASSGIGSAFARRLGAEGASVVLAGRDRARLESVAAGISAAGAEVELVVGDLADEAQLRALEQRLADPELDLLVNAAGLAACCPVLGPPGGSGSGPCCPACASSHLRGQGRSPWADPRGKRVLRAGYSEGMCLRGLDTLASWREPRRGYRPIWPTPSRAAAGSPAQWST